MVFPIRINQGGTPYNFCPGKATWDAQAVSLYRLLVIASETGVMLKPGSLENQPDWWIETLSSFIGNYKALQWFSNAKTLLGKPSGKETPGGGHPR